MLSPRPRLVPTDRGRLPVVIIPWKEHSLPGCCTSTGASGAARLYDSPPGMLLTVPYGRAELKAGGWEGPDCAAPAAAAPAGPESGCGCEAWFVRPDGKTACGQLPPPGPESSGGGGAGCGWRTGCGKVGPLDGRGCAALAAPCVAMSTMALQENSAWEGRPSMRSFIESKPARDMGAGPSSI